MGTSLLSTTLQDGGWNCFLEVFTSSGQCATLSAGRGVIPCEARCVCSGLCKLLRHAHFVGQSPAAQAIEESETQLVTLLPACSSRTRGSCAMAVGPTQATQAFVSQSRPSKLSENVVGSIKCRPGPGELVRPGSSDCKTPSFYRCVAPHYLFWLASKECCGWMVQRTCSASSRS